MAKISKKNLKKVKGGIDIAIVTREKIEAIPDPDIHIIVDPTKPTPIAPEKEPIIKVK